MSSDAASAAIHPKKAGEEVEDNILQRVTELRYVTDQTAEWHDARVETLLEPPHDAVTFYGVNLLAVGSIVECKGAQYRYANGQRGRWYIRKGQHERLLDAGGFYALAVYDPRDRRLRAIAVIPASLVDELLPDDWITRDDRAERGYNQLGWARLLDPEEVGSE
jgi:hypothetical protein